MGQSSGYWRMMMMIMMMMMLLMLLMLTMMMMMMLIMMLLMLLIMTMMMMMMMMTMKMMLVTAYVKMCVYIARYIVVMWMCLDIGSQRGRVQIQLWLSVQGGKWIHALTCCACRAVLMHDIVVRETDKELRLIPKKFIAIKYIVCILFNFTSFIVTTYILNYVKLIHLSSGPQVTLNDLFIEFISINLI
jgi:hypothetical protein